MDKKWLVVGKPIESFIATGSIGFKKVNFLVLNN
jgi:hypothetical protein